MKSGVGVHKKEPFPCIGHDEAVHTFRSAFAQDRLPGAFLILGPHGVGKQTYAYHCAWHVLSQNCSKSFHSVLVHQMQEGTADGLFVCAGLKIESVQAIRAYLRRSLGRADGWRIIVVPRVDLMTSQAMAALLKSVEEPPPRTIFLMTARTLGDLSAPLVSRCQRIDLKPLSKEAFESPLKEMCLKADKTLTTSLSSSLYQRSNGCLGIVPDVLSSDQESNEGRYRTLLLGGLLQSDHPHYTSPFHIDQQDFWGGCDVFWYYERFESCISDLLVRQALGEPLSEDETTVVRRLSPEGWARFLFHLKETVDEAMIYHLSPLQVAPHFFRVEPYQSF